MKPVKCPKCGTDLNDDYMIVWKCPECGKAFKVSFSKLNKIHEWKRNNIGKYLIKCLSCGYTLDDGDEKIACKCLACGNVLGGNLEFFLGEVKNPNNDEKVNIDNQCLALIGCPGCGKKILSDSKICSYCGYLLEEKKNTKKFLECGRAKVSECGYYIKKYISEMLNLGKQVKYILIICAIIMIVVILAYKPLANQVIHQKEVKATEENKCDDALSNETLYIKAKKIMESQEYDEAIKIFEQLKGYQDSSEMITECHYQKANQKFSLGEYETAADIFFSLREYKDSVNRGIESIYHSAEKCYRNEDYYTAIEILSNNYSLLKNYEETDILRNRIFEQNEWFFNMAEQEYADGNFECANQCYIYAKKNNYKLPYPNYYVDSLRMASIQGEFIIGSSKNRVLVNGFKFNIDNIEYTIEPDILEGTDELVGYLNGDRKHYLEFPVGYSDPVIIVDCRNGKQERDYWTRAVWYDARQDDKKRESEQQQKQQKLDPAIGMTGEQVEESSWGKPNKINKTTFSWGVTEQWCYPNYKYIYLDDGIVTAIQE